MLLLLTIVDISSIMNILDIKRINCAEEIMKKLSFLLVIVLLFSMTSCEVRYNNTSTVSTDSSGSKEVTTTNNSKSSCTHLWNEATCTEPKSCSKCQQTSGEPLGHTTDSGLCTRCGENFSSWKVGEYVDEFKQPTGKKYISVESTGTFSNSATTNSELIAILQIDNDDIGIMLWEYGSQLVKGIFDYENYNIVILDKNGTKHSFSGTIYDGGTRIYFKDGDRNSIVNLLKNNDVLKIYISGGKYTTSTYLFDVETKGFSTAYNSIK